MKQVNGVFFAWKEVQDAVQSVLDDKTVEVYYEDGTYGAYSESSSTSLDMGQIDARLAQYLGLDSEGLTERQDKYVGYACVFGLILITQEEEGGVWSPAGENREAAGEDIFLTPPGDGKRWLKAKKKSDKVVILVERGVVTGVYASNDKLSVEVLDTDTDDGERALQAEEDRRELQSRIDVGELHDVY